MKRISLTIMSLLYISAGIYHFVNPAFYLKIMPLYIPSHLFLIYLSGAIEIILGVSILIKRSQKIGGWLIIAMLFAFIPVHIQMIANTYSNGGLPFIIALIRFPIQFVLMYWVYKSCDLKFSRSI